MFDAFLDALLDTLKILPVLFITYLLIEIIEHKAGNKVNRLVAASGKAGPLLGSCFGLIPQCGFSGAIASLFAAGTVSLGTLIAVFLTTSDEMLPILISESISPGEILTLLGIKLASGVFFGFAVDLIFRRSRSNTIEKFCESDNCDCEHDGVLVSAVKHTAKIIIVIFAVSLVLNFGFVLVGDEFIGKAIISVPVVGELITGLIGLIPNCSSSVALTNLYVGQSITTGQLISGLCVNGGVGLIVLYRANKNIKENLAVTGLLYVFGVITGCVVSIFA